MTSLEELTNKLEKAESVRDGRALHDALGGLFYSMGFSKCFELYGASVKTWKFNDRGDIEVGANVLSFPSQEFLISFDYFARLSKFPVEHFLRQVQYERKGSFFEAITTYKSFNDLNSGVYDHSVIRANSNFDLPIAVADMKVLRGVYPGYGDKKVIEIALSHDRLVRKGDLYYFKPKDVVTLASIQPKTFYFALVNKNES